MDQAAATTMMREIYEKIIDGGDYSLIEKYFHPDYVDHTALGDMASKDAFVGMLEGFRAAMPGFRHEITDVTLIAEDMAVWQVHMKAEFTGEFMGVKGSGQPVELWVVNAGRLSPDGRAVEHWALGSDTMAEMAKQMGLPAPDGA